MEPKYPNITVKLSGKDGNAFAVLGAVKRALEKNNVPQAEIDAFYTEATSGDYDHLLETAVDTVNIE